ncbi:MAG: 4-alpha-glucanotransferase, partial [Clostridia bacterium]|nr:4-alpha-glucanotransferase [Clostridia bacterium]
MRKNGVLLPIFSLPSDYGIGSLGKECVKFIDFLSNSGVNVWQILPVNPTSFGDSPYQSFSTFAGNPYFIDLELLVEDGFLLREDLPKKINDKKIDYAALYKERFALLKKAFNYSFESNHKKVEEFCQNNPFVQDYALFMAIKDSNFGMPWYMWEDDYKFRTTLGMK